MFVVEPVRSWIVIMSEPAPPSTTSSSIEIDVSEPRTVAFDAVLDIRCTSRFDPDFETVITSALELPTTNSTSWSAPALTFWCATSS